MLAREPGSLLGGKIKCDSRRHSTASVFEVEEALPPSIKITVLTFLVKKSTMKHSG